MLQKPGADLAELGEQRFAAGTAAGWRAAGVAGVGTVGTAVSDQLPWVAASMSIEVSCAWVMAWAESRAVEAGASSRAVKMLLAGRQHCSSPVQLPGLR